MKSQTTGEAAKDGAHLSNLTGAVFRGADLYWSIFFRKVVGMSLLTFPPGGELRYGEAVQKHARKGLHHSRIRQAWERRTSTNTAKYCSGRTGVSETPRNKMQAKTRPCAWCLVKGIPA